MHKQLQNMDLVYRNAEVAIIAAAGKDSLYGLLGVGGRFRTPQPCMSRFDIVALRECSMTEWTARIVAGSTLWVVWGLAGTAARRSRSWRFGAFLPRPYEIVNDFGGSTDCLSRLRCGGA